MQSLDWGTLYGFACAHAADNKAAADRAAARDASTARTAAALSCLITLQDQNKALRRFLARPRRRRRPA